MQFKIISVEKRNRVVGGVCTSEYCVITCMFDTGKLSYFHAFFYKRMLNKYVGKVVNVDFFNESKHVEGFDHNLRSVMNISYGSGMDVFLFRKSLCDLE